MWLSRFVAGLLHPIPDPKGIATWLASKKHLQYLSQDESLILAQYVIEEVWVSRRFGLYIKKEHVLLEILFFLTVIDRCGGIARMRKTTHYEEARRFITFLMGKCFEHETQFYFARAKKRREHVLNKYHCHLECTLTRLLREIYASRRDETPTVH